MDAVILAAGLGTRLRPHTNTTPKPLLPVQGRPILEWTLQSLPPEVDRVIVVTEYLAEQFDEYLAKQTLIKNWVTVRQGKPQGTGHALQICKAHAQSDRVLVLNGDDLYGAADLAVLASKPAGVLAHPVAEPRKFGIAFRNNDGTLREMIEKPEMDGPQLANIGAYVFPKAVFDIPLTLSTRNEYEVTEAVDKLAKAGAFHVVEATFWFPIGDVQAWDAAQAADLTPVKRA